MSSIKSKKSLEEIYPYHIVEFISKGRRPKVRKTDVVATKWIKFDVKKKKAIAKYPPPPYDDNTSAEYDKKLQNLGDPPESWLEYTVQIKGKGSKDIF